MSDRNVRKDLTMPRYPSSGGGAPITTSSPIYAWGQSTCEGAAKPEYATNYPADSATHRHQAPKGERKSYNDATPPKHTKSGANYAGKGPGKTAAPSTKQPSGYLKAANPGVPHKQQDRFNKGFGKIGSGEGRRMRTSRDGF
jgi:hypothetical protein